jgi:hypothetical protein
VVDAAPFQAVRYDPSVAGDATSTSAPAYEDVEPLAYAAHRTASPYTVLELLSRGQDYTAAGAALARWRRTGVLVRDTVEAFYLYEEHELRSGVPAVQRGVLAAVALEPLDGTGAILPHEEVDPDRVADRLARLEAVPIDVAPVFTIYEGVDGPLRRLLARPPRSAPIVAATDADGTDHRIWRLDDPAEIAAISHGLSDVRAVIADGHHRYATALAHAARRAGTPGAPPDAPWNRTLVYLVDIGVHGPRVLPVHRSAVGVARDALVRVDQLMIREPGPADPLLLARAVAERGGMGLLLGGAAHLLRARDAGVLRSLLPAGHSAPWCALESAAADHVILPALGAERTIPRSDPGAAAAELGPDDALLLLPPVSPTTVIDLASAGDPMPPKTTSFRPKPRTGLLLRDAGAPT